MKKEWYIFQKPVTIFLAAEEQVLNGKYIGRNFWGLMKIKMGFYNASYRSKIQNRGIENAKDFKYLEATEALYSYTKLGGISDDAAKNAINRFCKFTPGEEIHFSEQDFWSAICFNPSLRNVRVFA